MEKETGEMILVELGGIIIAQITGRMITEAIPILATGVGDATVTMAEEG